jgi:hypothetical protein
MKWLKRLYMAIINKKENTEKVRNKRVDNLDLTKDELEFLLNVIANSTFEGKDVQLVYETAVKIQKQIMEL